MGKFHTVFPWDYANEPCHQLWHRMFVWQDGKVNPLVIMIINQNFLNGMLKIISISEIWNSKEYNKYRSVHLDNVRKKFISCD